MPACNLFRGLFPLIGLLTLAAGPALSHGDEPAEGADPPRRPNIVLFVTDDQSTTLGCYGDPAARTPHADRLAAEGTRFTHAFATTASCSAGRSVILTGLHNHANAQYGHIHSYHHFHTRSNLRTLPVLLSEAGYLTARIGKFHVGPEEVYRFDRVLPGPARSPVQMADNCREVISQGEQPFFLYFCTSDPHRGGGSGEPPHRPDLFGNRPAGYPGVEEVEYAPEEVVVPPFLPDNDVTRAELAQYYQSVARIDQGLGRLIELLVQAGVYDNTLIVFTSDHGMAFAGAKTTVYEPGLHVPFLVRHPGAQRRGVVNRAMISFVDITPTLLAAAGVEPPARMKLHGRSFLDILEREQPESWDEIYASHTFHEVTMYYPMRVVRDRRYKLIWNIAHPLPYPFASDLWASPTWQHVYRQGPEALYGKRTVAAYIQRPEFELYDLREDPHEVNNLAGDAAHRELLQTMQTRLRQWQRQTDDPWILKWEYE